MKVLVTGASGFLARTLAERLRQEMGVHTVGVGRTEGGNWDQFYRFDSTNGRDWHYILFRYKPDFIFHLMGANFGSDEAMFRVNLMSSVILLEKTRELRPDSGILLIGSAAEYGPTEHTEGPISETHPCRPRGPYGISKFAMTTYALDFAARTHHRINVARPFNIIGPGIPKTLLVGALLDRVRSATDSIEVGNVDSERDFIDVGEAADAMVRIMKSNARGEIFNICSARATPVRDVVERILAMDGRGLRYKVNPNLLRSVDPKTVVGDGSKLEAVTGFRARRSVAESLQSAWEAAQKIIGNDGE